MSIRIWKGCSKPLARHSCYNSTICCCMATAIRTQARAASSTPLVFGAAMPISPQRRTLGDPAVRRTVRVDRR
jgi:hypothetical protein